MSENTNKSEWIPYINALLGDKSVIYGGAIYGRNLPPLLWAESPGFIKQDEVKRLYEGLTTESMFYELSGIGFKINGKKFMKINSEIQKVVRGKMGEYAAAAALSNKAIIIAVGKGSPQDISVTVEKMAADLSSKGF